MLTATLVRAESLTPEEVVRLLIRAAHDNNLQTVLDTANLVIIAEAPRHGRSPKNLIEFLRGIKLEDIQFQEIQRDGWPDRTGVRMTAPLNIDFDLELVKATYDKQEDYYMVVGIHP